MSLDFPDRSKWLAYRKPVQLYWNLLVSGGTHCVGRNAQKRRMGRGRQRVRARKRLQREMRARDPRPGRPVRPHRSGGQRGALT